MIPQRIAKINKLLKRKGIGAFLVTNPLNIYYISGFKTDISSLLITPTAKFIITDFRYKEEAGAIHDFKTILVKGGFGDTLKKILNDSGVKRLGFESDHLSYAKASSLKAFLKKEGVGFEPLNDVVENLRIIKNPEEIAGIKKTILIAKRVVSALKKEIRPGITERGLLATLGNLIRTSGGDSDAFEPIIASGKNSSKPHAGITDKVIRINEHVLVDFGIRLNSYNCDLTRVFFLGRIQCAIKNIYSICKEAQARAIKMIRPGIRAKDLDAAARNYISSKGFGKFFGHSLGHGVGLEVHELPRISPKSNLILNEDMVFTVEPGIYLEGIGGVRLEEMVLVTKKGCEILTDDIPK
jgi:Xaa-Pro aminopeptidase